MLMVDEWLPFFTIPLTQQVISPRFLDTTNKKDPESRCFRGNLNGMKFMNNPV